MGVLQAILLNLMAIFTDHARKVYQQNYPNAEDFYVIQDLSKLK